MKRRPTRRAFVITGIGALLIMAAATAQAGWLFVLAAGVLGLVGGSFAARHRLGALEVIRSVPRRARVGDELRLGYAIRNSSKRGGAPMFTVEDTFGPFPTTTVGSERLGPGESSHVELVRMAARRGRFVEGTAVISSAAPFGLVRSKRRLEVPGEVTIVPRWVDLTTFPIFEPSSAPSEVLHERPRAGAGEEFVGVREFRPGDPLRSVHWRSTARAGNLIVREFEQEISSRAGIVLAGADHGTGPASSFETLVSAAASVGLYALSTGHPVHMARAGTDGVESIGDPSRHDLLDWLASATAGDVELQQLVDEALARIGGRGTVVLCVDSAGTTGTSIPAALDHIERAGARTILVRAKATSWDESTTDQPFDGHAFVPLITVERDRELGACLAV
ncbi:MAG: hypothetical protein QOG04_358 [Actinomycetota bacterium]|jgi:uncharacterized protein (DUF58 family)|nr:hypothetical protein [Actinomycetota bacterium]